MHRAPKLLLGLISLFAALTLSACGDGKESNPPDYRPDKNELRSIKLRVTTPVVSSQDAATFANDNLAFSVDMYLALRPNQQGNFLFSQTSLSNALAMLYAGSANATASQMADALHFSLPAERLHAAFNSLDLALKPPSNTDPNAFRLEIANSVWVQKDFSILPIYLDTLAENYGAGVFTADFQAAPEPARTAINAWVGNHTGNQIPTLFPSGTINTLTRLVLANAVLFHGDWKIPFKKDSPMGVFHTLTGDALVPTMHGSMNGGIWSGPGWNAAAVDYVGDTISMIVVMPDAGTFAGFETSLSAQSLNAIFAGIHGSGADIVMPRFKFATDVSLQDTLSALGMPIAFSDQADFSGINGQRNLSVQAVMHKAIIEVDEKGTTASAATGASVGVTSLPPTLVIDRPFLFFIRHNATGAILFQGRVVDPR